MFARIEDKDEPIAYLSSEEWANQVARLTSRDKRLDPSPECHVVPSGPDADWLLWDRELRDNEEAIQWAELDWSNETCADQSLSAAALLSPDTKPAIGLSPMLRAKVVADILLEALPDERAPTPDNPGPTVTIGNWAEGGKEIAEAFKTGSGHADDDAKRTSQELGSSTDGEDGEGQAPALTKSEQTTLTTMANFDPSRLASASDVSAAMPAATQLSDRTIGPAIRKLISLELAERPEGDKQGARLTIKGRKRAAQLAD